MNNGDIGKGVWQRMRDAAALSKKDPETGVVKKNRAAKWLDAFSAYNASIANSLGELSEQPQDIQGRDEEIELLQAIIERPVTPVALLIAEAGTGKTALVEEFVKRSNYGNLSSHTGNHYMLFALRLGEMAALKSNKLQAALAGLFGNLKRLEDEAKRALADPSIRIVLFIDEIHMLVTIFGPGTKIGGDVLKDMLARSPIRVIGATTRREYDSTIAVDKPLAERFKQVELRELGPEVVMSIAKNWWEKVAPDDVIPEDDVLEYVITSNRIYRPQDADPRKTLDVLEDLVSYQRRTGCIATRDTVNQVFHDRFAISLGFKIDADKVFGAVEANVFGQPAAMRTLDLLLHATAYKVEQNADKPIFTALFTGPTASGKRLADDTPIPSPDAPSGYIAMGDLKVGDRVYDENGDPTRVTAVYHHGLQEAWKLVFGAGEYVVCGPEHRWNVRTEVEMRSGRSYSTRTLQQMIDGGLPTHRVRFDHECLSKFHIPANGAVKRKDAELDVDPYLFGRGLAYAVRVDCTDTEITDTYRIPREYLLGSVRQRLDLLHGIMDHLGRRGYSNERGKCIVSVNSKPFAADFAELCASLGFRVSIIGEGAKRVGQRYSIAFTVASRNYDALFSPKNGADPLRCLPNKTRRRQAGVQVRYAEKLDHLVTMTCITVEAPSHLYQCGRAHLVTSNTSTTKAIAGSLYPGENVMVNVNMPDYSLNESEPAFRKYLGETLRHTPNAVLLLDEFEKAAPNIRRSMLAILDEGIVRFTVMNREGREEIATASLRDAVIICTTNAGASIFEDDQKFNRDTDKDDELDYIEAAQVERLLTNLRQNLIAHDFTPEMLGRFDAIVPFRALGEKATLKITRRELDSLIKGLKEQRGITIHTRDDVQWDRQQYDCIENDVVMYVAYKKARIDDPNSGGARNVKREVESTVFHRIVRAIQESDGATEFDMYVDNAMMHLLPDGSESWTMESEGDGVIVVPHVEEDDEIW